MQVAAEHFSAPLKLPLWALYGIVVFASPWLLAVLLFFDDPLIPSLGYASTSTSYQFSQSAKPPGSNWKPVSQFDAREAPTDGSLISVWQVFEAPQSQSEQLSIFIPVMFANYRIYVGDDLIAQPAPMTRPLYINRVPRLYPVSRTQLEAAGNRIYINSVRETPFFDAYPVFVGPFAELSVIYESHRNQRVFAPIIALVIILLLTAAIGILWMLSPSHTSYGWYAATTALFACHSTWFMIAQAPVTAEVWSLLGRLTVFMALTSLIFYHRYFGVVRPRTEIVMGLILVAAAAYMAYAALADFSNYYFAMNLWAIVTAVVTLYAIGFLLWNVKRLRNFEALLLAVNGVAGYVVSTRDLLFQMELSTAGFQYYMQYSSTVSACVFGYLLLRRFATSMREVEELNDDLERRVDEKAHELEESYAKLNEEEGKRVLAEERARIMRDMHDGLGGQLIHALALAEKGAQPADLSSALSFALQDLRLIIDSLAPDDSTLEKLLAGFRYRTTPMLEQAGIHASWDLGDDMNSEIGPKAALACLRFLQEGITNAVKHADPQVISITVQPIEGVAHAYRIAVHDDGKGFSNLDNEPDLTFGRGMNNMRIRAQEMGGEMHVQSDSTGTSVSTEMHLAESHSEQMAAANVEE